jgi:hypothetical protein
MLGTLTMPNILSPASPALFWAWLRYFLAPTSTSDLRITMDFSDLDPHQKGILSDDFGVAIATQWMADRFGTFTRIVDGRRFANQFTNLLRKKHKSKAKVGMSKAPDFVMRDATGKWHVLECKGTQTSRNYQGKLLTTAMVQKHAIQLAGAVRGEQLASSLYIANQNDRLSSHLKIVDPDDDEPLIRLTGLQAEEMDEKANRLAVAQALGSIGLNEIAVEMSLPPDIDQESELLLPSERLRLKSPRAQRVNHALEQVRERDLDVFRHHHRRYEGRAVELDLPPRGTLLPFRKVRIRQGVSADLLAALTSTGSLSDEKMASEVKPYAAEAAIEVGSTEHQTSLTSGDVFYSELVWE